MPEKLSVREIQHQDIPRIAHYFLDAEESFLVHMGVDINKMPSEPQWEQFLSEQISQDYPQKNSYCIIWLEDGKPIGHSNVNKIIFGEEAYMHLHIWKQDVRRKGMGKTLVKKTLPFFFNNLQLKKLYCEPNAFNIAPNKTLEKVGFNFIKTHVTTPGWLNFEQQVNLWEMSRDKYERDQKVD